MKSRYEAMCGLSLRHAFCPLLGLPHHDCRVAMGTSVTSSDIRISIDKTYQNMLIRASNMPRAALSVMILPPVNAPITTMRQVFRCPTTVLSTAPAPPIMKNCDRLINAARTPLSRIIIHLFMGAWSKAGNLSVHGTT